jgi:beta-N-acetylhexosaminidase
MIPDPQSISLEQAASQKILLAFQGKDGLPADIQEAIRRYRPGGFTLFRPFNLDHPAQVLELTGALQRAAREAGLPPFLIAVDQEGGQLMAIGEGVTPLPGNLALGAAGSAELAYRAGEVLGLELAAMGINVNYAPSCDVNVNPHNPVIGTRSFGEDPQAVAELSAAMVRGIQAGGVAATAKHFPGHGDTAGDSHHGLPIIPHTLERLRRVELPPFADAIRAGVKLVMTAHLALPAVDERIDLPATLSPAVLKGLLRRELGFSGVIITDAMDMGAIRQGEGLAEQAVRAAAAGADLLLLTTDPADHYGVYTGLLQAVRSDRTQSAALDPAELLASARRISDLKAWLADRPQAPDLSIVGCAAHRALAAEIAARAVTLVRDDNRLLPLRPAGDSRLAVVLPRPVDLTPADTSSYVAPTLAQALRRFHPGVDEFILSHAPQAEEIAALLEQLRSPAVRYQAVIIGTLNAFAQQGQAALVLAALAAGLPVVVVALRMPYDLAAFPNAPAYLCTYSILEPALDALARVLFGEAAPHGRLPVSIPGLYERGHSAPKKS